jgi:GAF domain-containing protein
MTQDNKISLELYQVLVRTVTESHHIGEMADGLTQLLVGSLGIKGAGLFIINPDMEELELVASAGLGMDYVNKGPILVDKSIKIGSNREPVFIRDVAASDRVQYPDKAAKEGVKAIVSYPVIVRGKIIGSLRLYHSEPWEISPDDIRFIEALSRTIGLCLLCFRLSHAVAGVKETVYDIHPVWL